MSLLGGCFAVVLSVRRPLLPSSIGPSSTSLARLPVVRTFGNGSFFLVRPGRFDSPSCPAVCSRWESSGPETSTACRDAGDSADERLQTTGHDAGVEGGLRRRGRAVHDLTVGHPEHTAVPRTLHAR
ncbi:hypothetical protein SAMN04487820_105235 [Actinopolyspora mzabensis]|uniref:Uncharacterized protein n=1 Tax=Actinopolyspora mzabensis TaxID=995066 RepID=A0A1G9A1F4_ACTMZ|nr:hypothetical protein SAMN04487820_105235 [Actinopolyspora mzabensis]